MSRVIDGSMSSFHTETNMTRETRIIDAEAIYTGTAHPWAKGLRVQIVAVLRGARVLTDDDEIVRLEATDLIAFAPEINENGKRRFSWVTSDATPADLKFD
jgi:hypothetical protein